MSGVLRREFCKYSIKWKFLSSHVKSFIRTLANQPVPSSNEDTLTGRFLLYLNNKTETNPTAVLDKTSLIRKIKSHPTEIKTFDAARVVNALSVLHDRELVRNKQEYSKLFEIIDNECCERLKEFNIEETFNLLNAFSDVMGYHINRSRYFLCALEHLTNVKNQLTKNQVIHLLFLIGLLKKNDNAQDLVRQCLKVFDKKVMDKLTKEDLCIICNSSFKTSTKVRNVALLNKVKCYINDNLFLLNDPAVFTTLIKTLRHNRYQDEDILSTITCTMFFNRTIKYYSFSAMCHILALYADYLYYDENVLTTFTKECLEQLKTSIYKTKNAYLEEQPRSKDIKRFLWALSNLNYKLSKNDLENIVIPQIVIRFKAGEFDNDPGSLVQIILYLWMMQYKAYNLIEGFLTRNIAQYITDNDLPSQDSLNLLLTCIYHEDQVLFQQLKMYPKKSPNFNLNSQLNKRPTLKRIIDNLKSIASENGIDKYNFSCQVPHINIIGITGFQKKIYKTVNIEVLDEYTSLKNTDNIPTGLMQLKLRILDKSDEGLVVLEKTDIMDYSDSELHHVLKDEIRLVS